LQLIFNEKKVALCENLIGDVERYLERKIQKLKVKSENEKNK